MGLTLCCLTEPLLLLQPIVNLDDELYKGFKTQSEIDLAHLRVCPVRLVIINVTLGCSVTNMNGCSLKVNEQKE